MTGKIRQGIFAICCLVCCLMFGVVPAKALSGVKSLCGYTGDTTTVYADVVGNGKNDTIRLEPKGSEYVEKLDVYINGKNALGAKNMSGEGFVKLLHIRMSKSKVFLQIIEMGDDEGKLFNRIYRYDIKRKKLVCVLNLDNECGPAGETIKVNSKGIQVGYEIQPLETGMIAWNYTYIYKNGKFKLKSSTAPVKSRLGRMNYYEDGYGAFFEKNKFVVSNTRSFYTGTNLKKVAFVAKRNDKLTLKKIKTVKGKVYLQFQKGKKTGWQRVDRKEVYNHQSNNPGSTGWFYGVYDRLVC